MKFLVDAQIPRGIARRLCAQGVDEAHTPDLPTTSATPADD
jgi:predicted nuclease of predicted toxin-antitoxin system